MKQTISFVALAQIQRDPSLQVREQLSEEKVTEYAQALSSGIKLPPIVLFQEGERYWLADGWHRLLAYEKNGSTLLSAFVSPGGRTQALLFAVGANADHGIPRTSADKRRTIRLLFSVPGWVEKSDRVIAKQCALTDHHLVAAVRRELEGTGGIPQLRERQGADGKTRTLPQTERKELEGEPSLSIPKKTSGDGLRHLDPEPMQGASREAPSSPWPDPEPTKEVFPPSLEKKEPDSPDPPPEDLGEPLEARPLAVLPHQPSPGPREKGEDLFREVEDEEEQKKLRHPLLRSGYVHWNTPPEVLEVVRALGPVVLDPCSNPWSQVGARLSWREEEDGLSRGWCEAALRLGSKAGLIFVNPPFGAQATPPWVKKCVEEARKGAEIVLLVPARTDLEWFQEGVWSAKAICFWRDRIEFWREGKPGPGASPFPALFAYWGTSPSSFVRAFENFGRVFSPPSGRLAVPRLGQNAFLDSRRES